MKIQEVPIDEITPYWHNPRKNDKTVERLVENIRKYGFQVPLVLDKNKVVIAGHARLKAAKKLGMQTVPCNIVNLSEEEAKRFRISDNKIAELSEWEQDSLYKELREIGDKMELLEMGFDLDEINSVIGNQEEFMDEMEDQGEYVVAEAGVVEQEEFVPKTFYSEPTYTEAELEAKLKQREAELENRFAKESYEQTKYDNLVHCPFCGQEFKVRGLK